MKAQKMLPAFLLSLVFGAWTSSAAHAACSASFAGNCTRPGYSGPAYCVFDANRDTTWADPSSCGNSTVSAVFWDFDDGSSTWDDTYVGHTFSDPASIDNDAVITMTLFCADGCVAQAQRYAIFVAIGCPGCIQMDGNWH